MTLLDSTFTNTPIAIKTAWTPSSLPPTAASLILENISLRNVPIAIQNPSGTLLRGTSSFLTIPAYALGHSYTPSRRSPNLTAGPIPPNPRPASLLAPDSTRYLTRSKPQYTSLRASSILSLRAFGARGDAVADDTIPLQTAIDAAVLQNKLLWLDYGVYRVTRTIRVPAGAKIVGESFPVIMSSGGWFDSATMPRAVVQVGRQGEKGRGVEMSDLLVATQGRQRGAVGVEWNLRTEGGGGEVSGMWDVHVRIGGARGTEQGVGECMKRPGSAVVQSGCVAAFMAMWITKGAGRVVLENVWLWWVILLCVCLGGMGADMVAGRRTTISTIRRIRRLRCTRDGGCVSL